MIDENERVALLTRGALAYAAMLKRPITYRELAVIQNRKSGSGRQNRALRRVMEMDLRDGHPILSSLCVSDVTNRCGKGFYDNCKELGIKCDNINDFIALQLECFKGWDIRVN